MRHSEFWSRMDEALGQASSRTWAQLQVIGELDSRTPVEALEAGVAPQQVWLAVWRTLELPERLR